MLHLGEIRRILEIGGITLLVAIDRVKKRAVAVERKIGDVEVTTDVAAARPLDLDDARTEVCEPGRGLGAGKKLGKVEDQQSFKRFHGLRLGEENVWR